MRTDGGSGCERIGPLPVRGWFTASNSTPPAVNGRNYISHDYIGHNYVGHNYTGLELQNSTSPACRACVHGGVCLCARTHTRGRVCTQVRTVCANGAVVLYIYSYGPYCYGPCSHGPPCRANEGCSNVVMAHVVTAHIVMAHTVTAHTVMAPCVRTGAVVIYIYI